MQQVKQSVMIANDLIGQYQAVMGNMARAAATNDDGDLSSMRAESARLYAAIWEHLDDAAARTRTAGRATDAYAAIRRTPELDAYTGVTGVRSEMVGYERKGSREIVTVEGRVMHNARGLELARQAVTALQASWPELDWTPPAPLPDVDLRPRGLFSRLLGRR